MKNSSNGAQGVHLNKENMSWIPHIDQSCVREMFFSFTGRLLWLMEIKYVTVDRLSVRRPIVSCFTRPRQLNRVRLNLFVSRE